MWSSFTVVKSSPARIGVVAFEVKKSLSSRIVSVVVIRISHHPGSGFQDPEFD